MTWQPPLPVIATVVAIDDRQADAAVSLFESLARNGGEMAGVDRVAYFRGEIGIEPAERLARLGVALKVVDEAAGLDPEADLIAAFQDPAESGFLIALAPGAVVRGDFSEWIGRGALCVNDDASAILIRRDLAADFGARWGAEVLRLRELPDGRAQASDIGVGALALSLVIGRGAKELVALPSDFPVAHDVAAASASGETADHTAPARHQTPGFDNQAFWNHRYLSDPARGSGVGSRGAPRALKESLIRRTMEQFNARTILDVGCGDLASVETLATAGYTGIDISEEVLRANRAKRPDWTFLCGDFVRLSEQQSLGAELVLCFDVLIHQHDFATYEAFVRQLVANCKGTGLIGAFQAPPRAPYRSQITAYHEPITRTLARVGATDIKVIASYRDTVVARFRSGQGRSADQPSGSLRSA